MVVCFVLGVSAQNLPPVVSNVTAIADTSNKIVTVMYDVNDNENDLMTIHLTISGDSGTSFVVPIENVSGDVGSSISSGTTKTIYWTYTDTIAWYLIKGSSSLNNLVARITAVDTHAVNVSDLLSQVDSVRMYSDMLYMSKSPRQRVYGLTHLEDTRDTIVSRFEQHNLQLSYQNVPFSGDTGTNIIARYPGTTDDASTVFITGHYDTYQKSPGADDNATAVAGMLETMRILTNYTFDRTLKFIAFDMEEDGLAGSLQYTGHGIPHYEKIKGVLDFEMIGYYSEKPNSQSAPTGFDLLFPTQYQALIDDSSRGNFITDAADSYSTELQNLFDSCAKAYVPDLKVASLNIPGNGILVPDLNRSDHAPFWWLGYQALMLSDGANYRNLAYHTVNDTIGALNMNFMSKVVKATLATAAHFAKINNSGYSVSTAFNLNIAPLSAIKSPNTENNGLLMAYPNPFTNQVTLEYVAEKKGNYILSIYSAEGKLVKRFEEKNQTPGKHQIIWNAHEQQIDLHSGIYNAILEGGGKKISENIIYLED